jgi:hypothetical protein
MEKRLTNLTTWELKSLNIIKYVLYTKKKNWGKYAVSVRDERQPGKKWDNSEIEMFDKGLGA